MSIGLDSYKFGRKNNWRRMIWNNALDRLSVFGTPSSECKVLYLPGPEDLDGQIAVQKGVKPWNLYAVEKDKKRSDALRSKKVNVINADLVDVVEFGKITDGIDFIFADFCCGLGPIVRNFTSAITLSGIISQHAVICVNLQRGREADLQWREKLGTMAEEKHRGRLFILLLSTFWSFFASEHWSVEKVKGFSIAGDHWNRIIAPRLHSEFFEYRSIINNVTLKMDSVIFNWGSALNFCDSHAKVFKSESAGVGYEPKLIDLRKSIRHRTASAQAINTMIRDGSMRRGF